ncbi:HAD-IIIA family hydrolase, partial [Georgenia thermotolerans]
ARRPGLAAVAGAAWAGLTADFAARRIAPGPGPGEEGWGREWATMAATSAVIPWAAVAHHLRGTAHYRGAPAWPPPVRAVLFDRDGTLVHDEPYNGDPAKVRPVDGAAAALRRLRAAGLAVGLVTNQSGVARGLLTPAQVSAVNDRAADLLGGFDTVQACPHGPGDRCGCRKPAPGMVLRAAAALGVAPWECVVVGDIGADVGAALAAGARAVLVPTPVTRREEVAAAPVVAADLAEAAELVLALAAPEGARRQEARNGARRQHGRNGARRQKGRETSRRARVGSPAAAPETAAGEPDLRHHAPTPAEEVPA